MRLLKSVQTVAAILLLWVAAVPASARQQVGPLAAKGQAVRTHAFRSGDIYFIDNAFPPSAPTCEIRRIDDHRFGTPSSAVSTFFANPHGSLGVLEYDAYRRSLIIVGTLGGGGVYPGTYAIDAAGTVSQFVAWGTNALDVASNGAGLIYILLGSVFYLDGSDNPHALIDLSTNQQFFFSAPNLTSVSKLYYHEHTNSLFALATLNEGCSTRNVVLQAKLDPTGTKVESLVGPTYLTDPCAVAFTLTSGPSEMPMAMSVLNGELWADLVDPARNNPPSQGLPVFRRKARNFYHGVIGVPTGTNYASCGAYSSSGGGLYLMGYKYDPLSFIRNLVYYSPTTGPLEVLESPPGQPFAGVPLDMIVIP